MTASFGKGVMIRDTLFTCAVLRRVVYLVSGYTHGERFVHRQGWAFCPPLCVFTRCCRFGNAFGLTRTERFVHPFGEVVICHPIDDGMFCPVTADTVLFWDYTDSESPFWALGPVLELSSMG